MSVIVSLQGYTPSPRFDGTPWYQAIIEESASNLGPWTTISTVVLTPADADPKNPQPRSFTVEGTIELGWYRVLFVNQANNDEEASLPIQNGLNYVPSVSQVGSLLRSRTKDASGNVLGTFTASTSPTYDEAFEMIASAVGTLSLRIGDSIPDKLTDEARRLAALRAAMLIELTFFPEQVSTGRSPYAEYKALWEEGYGDGTGKKPGTLVQAISSTVANENNVVAANPGMASFSFPIADNIGQRRM